MKLLFKIILSFLFVPLLLVTILAFSLKYQILSDKFWKESLSSGNTYQDLSFEIKNFAETKTISGGGNTGDIKILTDIASPNNIQDFVEKNITNFLDFVNNKKRDLFVYIPFSKIPSNLKPKSDAFSVDYLPYTALAQKFNIDKDVLPIGQIAYLGKFANYLLLISLSVLIIVSVLFIGLDSKNKPFFTLGINFLIAGPTLVMIAKVIEFFETSLIKEYVSSKHPGLIFLKIIVPTILTNVLAVWWFVGIGLFILGVVLLFLMRENRSL